MRELTEGFYSLEKEDGVELRTVELEVGEVNVADKLVEQGFAEREQNPRESNQDPPENRVNEVATLTAKTCQNLENLVHALVKTDVAQLKYGTAFEDENAGIFVPRDSMELYGTSMISTSDDEDMTAMVDLRGWSPKAEVEGKSSEESKAKEEEDIAISQKVEVEVLSVDSPACIWLREIASAWPHFNCLLQQQRSEIGKISEEELSLGKIVLVRISNLICRGELVKQNVGGEENKLEVRLVDHGKFVVLDKSEVGLLKVDELCAAPPFSFSVGIAEVEAAGTSDPMEWTKESTLALKEIIEGKEVTMEAKQTGGVAVIWVGERICENPFGVEQYHWKKVGDLLQQQGLAYTKGTAQFIRQKLNCPFESCEDNDATNSDVEEAGSSSKIVEIALESETDSVALSLPEHVEKKPRRHLGHCFSGNLVKMDQSGLVLVREAEQGEEVAVRLAGVRRVAGKDPSRLLQQLEPNAKCWVVSSGNGQRGPGPFTGDIFYRLPGRVEVEGNLALVGLEQGLLEVVTTWEEWDDEVDAEDDIPRGRSCQLPYPLPLALGLWLPVTISMVHPKLPLVFLRVRYVSPDTCFAQFRREMKKSLCTTMDQVARMEASFSQAREEFSRQAESGVKEKRHSVGDPVLALFEDCQEWCRGVVAKVTDTGATVDLSDYGHPANVKESQMRRLSKEMWQGPRQGRTVSYQPEADTWQEVCNIKPINWHQIPGNEKL